MNFAISTNTWLHVGNDTR